MAHKIDH